MGSIKFLAIDSSMSNTGVAVGVIRDDLSIEVESIHLISTEKTKNKQVRASSDTVRRCRETYEFVWDLIDEYDPKIIFTETPSGSQSSSAMKSYGITCMLIATIAKPPAIEVTPIEVKVASIGKKTASKGEIINWAYEKYPNLEWFWYAEKLQAKNEHMADAIATAYAGIKTNEFRRVFDFVK